MASSSSLRNPVNIIVVVAALGYFVDIYDLILFSVVRTPSLKSLGFSGDELLDKGVFLLNAQMIGMLIGGIIWGVLGDKKGRVSVLFGSIILYSIANILNGMVTSFAMYGWLRFIAGIGLAGELGAGITLVSETMTKEHRGYGTTIVASFGILGAVLAATVANNFDWQTAYYIGGVLGILLLFLRVGVYESGMYKTVQEKAVSKGNILQLFNSKKRFTKYISCIAVGLPIWYVVGILITFSPEFGKALGIEEPVIAGTAVMYSYIGLAAGDFISGYLSQLFKSRKKILFSFLILTSLFILMYLLMHDGTPAYLYFLCFALGFASGYWAVFITTASEQFGTNIRSTVTTTVPNFVRGAVVPFTLTFNYVKEIVVNGQKLDIVNSALIVGGLTMVIAFVSLFGLEETYGKELDYVEED